MRRRYRQNKFSAVEPQQVVSMVAMQGRLEVEVLRFTGVMVALMMLTAWIISLH
jgi:hypothetical protein